MESSTLIGIISIILVALISLMTYASKNPKSYTRVYSCGLLIFIFVISIVIAYHYGRSRVAFKLLTGNMDREKLKNINNFSDDVVLIGFISLLVVPAILTALKHLYKLRDKKD